MNPAYKRVYHYHVRKTAGTSLNSAFWALAGLDLRTMSDRQVAEGNGLKVVRGNPRLIEEGDYFFANSHQPAHTLRLPPSTFTVTILRDPASRAISYYSYLLWARSGEANRDREPFLDEVLAESAFLGRGPRRFLARLSPRRREPAFRDFLDRVPPSHLLTQLHMFSERLDPAEAAERALACSAVCFTETFPEDLRALAGGAPARAEGEAGAAVRREGGADGGRARPAAGAAGARIRDDRARPGEPMMAWADDR